MTGICGIVGDADAEREAILDRMMARMPWQAPGARARTVGPAIALGAVGPADAAAVAASGPIHVAIAGHPHWVGESAGATKIQAIAARLAERFQAGGPDLLQELGGDFALAVGDTRRATVLLAVDRIGIRNVIYQRVGDDTVFGASCDVVNAHPRARREVLPQGIYDYVYFHCVPGPQTVYRDHRRLPAAHWVEAGREGLRCRPYWQMRFVEDRSATVATLAPAFRDALRTGVAAYGDRDAVGTFLSGGTDSSTVAGTLRALSQRAVRTYSIGFAAAGYDEMSYARIAARHFGTEQREHYVTPGEVVDAVPRIAAAYDQPFGNASAVPTFSCARAARADGIERMLGGDGGDELFGGNSRYATQHTLAHFQRLPRAGQRLLEAVLLRGDGGPALVRKARSYVRQARLPMPARYETYNLLERLGPENVFAPDFLASVDRRAPLARLTKAYDGAHAASLINRILALDLKFTLADNDLPKVTRMCELAGVDVAFPLLHEAVVDFSAALPPDFKLRRRRLRWFFKEALRDFLPPEIINKEKHGFGLPAGQWLRDDPALHALAADAIAGLRGRGVFRRDLLDDLTGPLLREHPAYYGTLTWVLMMLELWFRRHADA